MFIHRFSRDVKHQVAVLYRAFPPIIIGGVRRDIPGSDYSESGADIAFSLQEGGVKIITPASVPDPCRAYDWVFPDTAEGISAARNAGANVLWANTVTPEGHPIEGMMRDVGIVGELPSFVDRLIDRYSTNAMLRRNGIPVPLSSLLCRKSRKDAMGLDQLQPHHLSDAGFQFPVAIKPARRGTEIKLDVALNFDHLHQILSTLLNGILFEDMVMLEQFLPGEELVVIVLAEHDIADSAPGTIVYTDLPPIARSNPGRANRMDISPAARFIPLPHGQAQQFNSERLPFLCRKASALVGALGPVAIACRADVTGRFNILGVKMNPDMAGPGRPGRKHAMAAASFAAGLRGFDYPNFLKNILAQAWIVEKRDPLKLYSDL